MLVIKSEPLTQPNDTLDDNVASSTPIASSSTSLIVQNQKPELTNAHLMQIVSKLTSSATVTMTTATSPNNTVTTGPSPPMQRIQLIMPMQMTAHSGGVGGNDEMVITAPDGVTGKLSLKRKIDRYEPNPHKFFKPALILPLPENTTKTQLASTMKNSRATIQTLQVPTNGKLGVTTTTTSVDTNPADTNQSNDFRKPCSCTKSNCLKLYCECFQQGLSCHNCNCTNCLNDDTSEERKRAVKSVLDRNPTAFQSKIAGSIGVNKKHVRGCNCKKSGCLKNYCECYEARILCSSLCRCRTCFNCANPGTWKHEDPDNSQSSTPSKPSPANGISTPNQFQPSTPITPPSINTKPVISAATKTPFAVNSKSPLRRRRDSLFRRRIRHQRSSLPCPIDTTWTVPDNDEWDDPEEEAKVNGDTEDLNIKAEDSPKSDIKPIPLLITEEAEEPPLEVPGESQFTEEELQLMARLRENRVKETESEGSQILKIDEDTTVEDVTPVICIKNEKPVVTPAAETSGSLMQSLDDTIKEVIRGEKGRFVPSSYNRRRRRAALLRLQHARNQFVPLSSSSNKNVAGVTSPQTSAPNETPEARLLNFLSNSQQQIVNAMGGDENIDQDNTSANGSVDAAGTDTNPVLASLLKPHSTYTSAAQYAMNVAYVQRHISAAAAAVNAAASHNSHTSKVNINQPIPATKTVLSIQPTTSLLPALTPATSLSTSLPSSTSVSESESAQIPAPLIASESIQIPIPTALSQPENLPTSIALNNLEQDRLLLSNISAQGDLLRSLQTNVSLLRRELSSLRHEVRQQRQQLNRLSIGGQKLSQKRNRINGSEKLREIDEVEID